ncbi:hypothetical protein HUG20_16855 [Salicibibacter cibi]|uniref:TcaA second domain-containing protein n=1 Tax=Salicibibacter cibi TaxID=2743001 RepID=A0A7T6ZDC6_9BACI|nr:hypothetical protein [Salicibibacter cibi]QQK81414.1 hypothetical protein HUG20_16855 [Salicibibacter cibi]
MTKKNVFIISGGVALFLIIGIGIAIGVSGSNDPQQLTEDFHDAIQENDVDAFKDVVEVDSDMAWPDEQIETTLEMMHEPEYFEETMQILNIQASYYEDEDMMPAGEVNIHELLNMGAFYIEEEDNVLGNSYNLRVRPYHLQVSADADADIHFLGDAYKIEEDG